jgi:hypothetical protein
MAMMATKTPPAVQRWLNRKDVCAELNKLGYPIKPATLARKASQGGGPAFKMFGGRALYDLDQTVAWAKGRMIHVPAKPEL